MRNWGLISQLAREHEIALLSFKQPGESVQSELTAACVRVETAPAPRRSQFDRLSRLAFSSAPDLAWRLEADAFRVRLRRMLANEPVDIVQIEGLEMGRYAATIRRGAPGVPIVYDAHNAETLIQRRALHTDLRQIRRWPQALYSAVQLPRLRRFERGVCAKADAVVCVSPADARALQRPATIVPNGILMADYTRYRPGSPLPEAAIVFTGKMDYRPNVDAARWFARRILPRVRARVPQAQFLVVGKKPAAAVRALDRLPAVTVTGAVPDVRPYIAGAALFVAPVRMGGGTRFKILEALAMARAVVATSIGAEGFDVASGRELVIADEPEAFAAACVELLGAPGRAAQLGAAGREFVAANYEWERIVPALTRLYERLAVATARAN